MYLHACSVHNVQPATQPVTTVYSRDSHTPLNLQVDFNTVTRSSLNNKTLHPLHNIYTSSLYEANSLTKIIDFKTKHIQINKSMIPNTGYCLPLTNVCMCSTHCMYGGLQVTVCPASGHWSPTHPDWLHHSHSIAETQTGLMKYKM